MTDKDPDIKPQGNARRKLLRGAFAAPAVLTVYSGGASAASVSHCLVNANVSPTTSGIGVTSADDLLFRYQLWALVDNSNSANVLSYWIRGADLAAFNFAGPPFLSSTQFQQFDITSNALVPGTVTSTQPATAGFTFQQVSRYVVLRVDSTGALVSAGGTGSGAPVSDSCWNSFALGPH